MKLLADESVDGAFTVIARKVVRIRRLAAPR